MIILLLTGLGLACLKEKSMYEVQQNNAASNMPETRQTEIDREFSRVAEVAVYIDTITDELARLSLCGFRWLKRCLSTD